MPEIGLGLGVVLVLVLAAEFVNGWTDAPNAIATVVSTRVLAPRAALALATILNVAGAFLGTSVAATIGKGFVDPEIVDLTTIAAAMVSIVVWSSVAAFFGLPTSESHALVSGLTGAAFAAGGSAAILADGWRKVGTGLLYSTFLGFLGGLLLTAILFRICARRDRRSVQTAFSRLQVFSAAYLALGHGSNDGQKFIGAFTLALLLGGAIPEFAVPVWVIFLCAGVMGLGTAVGGWRIIKTMGLRLTKLEPIHGFAAETSAATVMLAASYAGTPLSTTHTINTSIMGVGATKRLSAVRWGVGREIVTAWILTFPGCALIAYLVATGIQAFARLVAAPG
jgi:PiT family inorganic phosphate transporter